MPFRLVMVINALQGGGSARVMSVMANHWAEAGWHVHLITLDGAHEPFYALNAAVTQHRLDLSGSLGNPLLGAIRMGLRILRLRAAIERASADAVLSFNDETNVITVLATRALRVPVVVGERCDPHVHTLDNPWRMLRPWAYRRATWVVAQTQQALDYFGAPIRSHGKVIPNPVVVHTKGTRPPPLAHREQNGRILLGMGRLSPQKGFDWLIQAFAQVAARHQDWVLEIWGEGNERGRLESLVGTLGLQGRIRLPGVTTDPTDKMRKADLFVLSSRYEGFPNVLCEAMACGLPVIAFDCRSGPSAVIRDGANGILVPPESIDLLAGAIDRLMGSEAERIRLATAAPGIVHELGLAVIMNEWTELLAARPGKVQVRRELPHG